MSLFDFIEPYLTEKDTDLLNVLQRISIVLEISRDTRRGYGSSLEEVVSSKVILFFDNEMIDVVDESSEFISF